MRQTRRLVALQAALAIALSGCGAADDARSGSAGSSGDTPENTVTIFAAASLQSTFTALADEFEAAHPGSTVTLSFAGSSDLATQLLAGAPADLFASADSITMSRVAEEGLLEGEPQNFATNTLMIAVPPGNPAGIEAFEDLADPDHRVVLCAPQVPCGAAAVRAQEVAGVTVQAVSEESSVTDVLGKVRSGEADAGLVYLTDVMGSADAVEGIPFASADQAVTTYPAGILAGGNASGAQDFLDLLTGPRGQALLTDAGFGSP